MVREEAVTECEGCEKIEILDGAKFCRAYVKPRMWWRFGRICPLASHVSVKTTQEESKINPLKASKRSSKGK